MNTQGQWQVAGSGPEVYERELVRAVFGPWAPIVVELAHPRPSERVVDIACGTGIVARVAAARVGSTGQVAGIDLNPGMLSVARSATTTSPRSSAPIQWHEARLTSCHSRASRSISCIANWACSFFADRAAALREMRRVLGRSS